MRFQWMDFTRGVCILLVLMVHTSAAIRMAGFDYPSEIRTFNGIFAPFRMPLLMFLSGMLLQRSLSKSVSDNIIGKFSLIFWPFLLWSMMIYAAEGRLTLEYIVKTPISAPSLLWYLWFLTAYYVISIVINRLSLPILPLIILCLISAGFLPTYLRIDRFAFLLSFFLLGHYVNIKEITLSGKWPIAILCLAFAMIASYISATDPNPYGVYSPQYAWAPIGLALFVLWVSPYYTPSILTNWIEWIGRNSIVYYVIHFPVQVTLAKLLFASNTALNTYYIYGFVFVASIFSGMIMQILRKRSLFIMSLFDFQAFLRLFRSRGKVSVT